MLRAIVLLGCLLSASASAYQVSTTPRWILNSFYRDGKLFQLGKCERVQGYRTDVLVSQLSVLAKLYSGYCSNHGSDGTPVRFSCYARGEGSNYGRVEIFDTESECEQELRKLPKPLKP